MARVHLPLGVIRGKHVSEAARGKRRGDSAASGCLCPAVSLGDLCGHRGAFPLQPCQLEEQGPHLLRELPPKAFPQILRSAIGVPILTRRASQKTPARLDPTVPTRWEEPGLSTSPAHPGTSESGNPTFGRGSPGANLFPSLVGPLATKCSAFLSPL